jgi:hypothetical protein
MVLLLAAVVATVAVSTVAARRAGAEEPLRQSTEGRVTGSAEGSTGPSLALTGSDAASFSDVAEDAWYAPYVNHIASLGIPTRYPDGTYRPDQPVTRAQMAVFLVRALDLEPVDNPSGRFTDIAPTVWYAPHVELIAGLRITIGCNADGTRFCPRDPVTRAQMALYVAQAFRLPRADVETPSFEDVRADHYAYEAVEAIRAANITAGCADDPPRYCGTRLVTRAHMAAFLSRALAFSEQAGPSIPDIALPPTGANGRGCRQLFEDAFVESIAAAHPGARFTAAVHDHRTGCEYHLNPHLELTTASVVKAQVLAGVLLAAQDAGRRLTPPEVADIELMMHFSHNRPPTSRLYLQIGGARGMEELDERFGITGTSHTAWYGATRSTAEDRTRLVEQLLIGGGPLHEASVQTAWEWMSGVSAAQSWGVTAGLPSPYRAALKNGFFPASRSGWRLGTTGVVRDPHGGAYAMTVMTDNNPNEPAGITLVEAIARHINSALTTGVPAERAVDLVECVEPPRGSSWSSAAEMLGGVDTARLRHLNGGEAAPLAGQRVCWA